MASQVADYEIVGPNFDERVLPCLGARRPARLGGGDATVWVLGPVARAPWDVARARLEAVAAVRSPQLPSWLETGTGEWAQRPVVWVSSANKVAGTLASPLGAMSTADKLRALAAAARAAHVLHEHGQLHGAICPQAVAVVANQPEVPLSGFGGAFGSVGAQGETGTPSPSTYTGILAPPSLADGMQPVAHVGYPPLGYADPQLLRGEGGRWSDIWGLGATAHQLLTGSPPFPGLEDVPVVQGLARLLSVPTPSQQQLPGQVAALVSACLSADPLDRPATAKDVAERLEDAAARW
jgi:eukaryotic-like serine/threonine-protein kinase